MYNAFEYTCYFYIDSKISSEFLKSNINIIVIDTLGVTIED